MHRELAEYIKEAEIVSRSSFLQSEKDRHYRELLAHMRGQYGVMIHAVEDINHIYLQIKDMIGKC